MSSRPDRSRSTSTRVGRGPGRAAAVLLAATLALSVGACGGDDDGEAEGSSADDRTTSSVDAASPSPAAETVTLDDLAAASGGAPAAIGAGLAEPPGAADRGATVSDVGEVAASITAADGTVTGCCLLVAASDQQRQRGLMEVTDLGGYQGMVFMWDHDVEGGFWMRNTPTPLSIAWFDADGAFVSATDMAPCSATAEDCPVYPPEGSYRFAVEVFQGDLDALGVGPGSRLALGGECAEAAGG